MGHIDITDTPSLYSAVRGIFDGGVWKAEDVPVFKALGRYLAEEIIGTGDLSEFNLKSEQISYKIGHRITAEDIGIFAAMGKMSVSVWHKPYVIIITTGEELVTPFETPGENQMRDSGSFMLSALLEETGVEVISIDMINEGSDAIDNAVRCAADHCDVVVMTTGTQEGAEEALLSITDNIREPGVIARGPVTEDGGNVILAVLKDEFCHCVGRMPALVVCLPGDPAKLAVNYRSIVDYFIRRYYFHDKSLDE